MATLTRGISFAELSTLSENALNESYTHLTRESTKTELEEQLKELDLEIQAFESAYNMKSNAMRDLLKEDKILECADICSWLMLLEIKEEFNASKLST